MSVNIYDVAVVGAGISGLAAASRLQHGRKRVVVLESSDEVGGRAATSRINLPPNAGVLVDYGTQCFTAHSPRFREQVERWEERGICFPWTDGLWKWKQGVLSAPDPLFKQRHYACRNGMKQLGRNLAEGVEVILEYHVASVELIMGIWHIHPACSQSTHTPVMARMLFVSTPLPVAFKLLGQHLFASEECGLMGRIAYEPTITVVGIYPEGITPPPWQAIEVDNHDSQIFRIAWDSSRRKRGSHGAVAVVHAVETFSNPWLEPSAEALRRTGQELLVEASKLAGDWMKDHFDLAVHRWRYGRSVGPRASMGFVKGPGCSPLYIVGDGLNGGMIEGAWLSGTFAAEDCLHKKRQLGFLQSDIAGHRSTNRTSVAEKEKLLIP